jgi:hypothetical protein
MIPGWGRDEPTLELAGTDPVAVAPHRPKDTSPVTVPPQSHDLERGGRATRDKSSGSSPDIL